MIELVGPTYSDMPWISMLIIIIVAIVILWIVKKIGDRK